MNSKVLIQLIMVAILSLACSQAARAEITVTAVNKTDYPVSMAFRWAGFDMEDDRRSGWEVIPAGETVKIKIEEAVYALTAQDFAYYAKGQRADGQPIFWHGKKQETDRPHTVIIHPTNDFSGHPNDPIKGGKSVRFRNVKLVEIDDGTSKNGKVTISMK